MALVAVWLSDSTTYASGLDPVGISLLQSVTTNLNGAGVPVAQAEAGAPTWQVIPSSVGLPASDFTYFNSSPPSGMANVYPNSLGTNSPHANAVGAIFYGIPGGMSTNVAHVDNYEASFFYFTLIPKMWPMHDRVVNQSFYMAGTGPSWQKMFDTYYDNYAAQANTLFISAVGDDGTISPPSTSYNGIGVGAYGGATGVGPTLDNGRAKPDITAPGGATSFSAPLVSGAAAILIQAGSRGDGGVDTVSAVDTRTVKALLLNGAIKPSDWANPSPSPLDPRYGAGVLNVFNSYKQLAGGKHPFIASSSIPLGSPHPGMNSRLTVDGPSGWDFDSVSSSISRDGVNHYVFNLPGRFGNFTYTATITLVWNRQSGSSNINNLDLFLCNGVTGAPMAASTSVVDNVEHIYLSHLPPGRYDVQVLKHGGLTVSSSEVYALAFEFFALPLNIKLTGKNATITWPVYPTGFVLESNPNQIGPTVWSPVNIVPVVTNNLNTVVLDASQGNHSFRLRRP
jgi:hypothetical protein